VADQKSTLKFTKSPRTNLECPEANPNFYRELQYRTPALKKDSTEKTRMFFKVKNFFVKTHWPATKSVMWVVVNARS
jgi:hypothetical protein